MTTSFEEFYQMYLNKIFTYCKYRITDYSDAQDITSDTFHKFIKAKGMTKSNPVVFLYVICRYAVIDYYRKHSQPHATLECIEQELHYQDDFTDQIHHRKQLLNMLEQVDADTKEAIRLKYVQDLDIQSISQVMGKSESATKSIIYRGLTTLKQEALKRGDTYV